MSERWTPSRYPELSGRTIIVTGAAAGIGRAIAEAFHEQAARVVIADLTGERLQRVRRETADDPLYLVAECDVSDRSSVDELIEQTVAAFGPPAVLVNNAGVSTPRPFSEITDDDWERVMGVNAKGTFLCSQSAVRVMRAHEGGTIINMSSQAAQRGQAYISHYCASKAAVLGLTKAMARELAPHIRVNAVAPGTVVTTMLDHANARLESLQGLDAGSLMAQAIAETPLGRLQTPESVAGVVTFLASDAARDLTGQCLSVSGGLVM